MAATTKDLREIVGASSRSLNHFARGHERLSHSWRKKDGGHFCPPSRAACREKLELELHADIRPASEDVVVVRTSHFGIVVARLSANDQRILVEQVVDAHPNVHLV